TGPPAAARVRASCTWVGHPLWMPLTARNRAPTRGAPTKNHLMQSRKREGMGKMLETTAAPAGRTKVDRDAIFFELTRSICPECRRVIDAQILLRDNKVIMRKRCPDHGQFEALVYGDAAA